MKEGSLETFIVTLGAYTLTMGIIFYAFGKIADKYDFNEKIQRIVNYRVRRAISKGESPYKDGQLYLPFKDFY